MTNLARAIGRLACLGLGLLFMAACTDAIEPTALDLQPSFDIVPHDGCSQVLNGRITGGGHQFNLDGVRVTRGFTLHCDITLSNNLEINWAGGNKWHIERENLEAVKCTLDPAYDSGKPDAPFNTFRALATGSLNGVDGSIVRLKLIDDGEPGRTDEAHFIVYEPGQGPGQVPAGDEVIAMQVGGQLDGGNIQTHYDQPHR